MSQVINTNIASITAQRNLNESSGALQQSIERLSSGLRINSAADDAAGLAISERFSAQIGGLEQAQRNSQDGISFAQTAEGGLEEIGNIAQRVRELAVQSANDTNSASDRQALNEEVQQLTEEANRIAQTTAFNNQNVLDGSLEELVFQVGANEGQTIDVTGVNARSNELGRVTVEANNTSSTTSLGQAVDRQDLTNGDTIDINGVEFTYQADADASANEFTSQQDLANLVNNADYGTSSSVSAIQPTELDANLGAVTATASPTTTDTLTVNGTDAEFTVGTSASATAQNAVDAINSISSQTGVSAEVRGGSDDQIAITNTTGDPVTLETNTNDLTSETATTTETTIETGLELSVSSTNTDDLNVQSGDSLDSNLGLDAAAEANELAGVDVSTQESASSAISTVDAVIDQVNSIRGELGAVQNRFESTISNLGVTTENLEAARSRIVDTDFASETAELTQNQILQQAGTSVLGQANQIPQNVVSLLQ